MQNDDLINHGSTHIIDKPNKAHSQKKKKKEKENKA
jgi:hypothetical protein